MNRLATTSHARRWSCAIAGTSHTRAVGSPNLSKPDAPVPAERGPYPIRSRCGAAIEEERPSSLSLPHLAMECVRVRMTETLQATGQRRIGPGLPIFSRSVAAFDIDNVE